tara:strand:+ start:2246 stop:3991 length:1746 start_codon:yes stop_codon:yes gene_type:complete
MTLPPTKNYGRYHFRSPITTGLLKKHPIEDDNYWFKRDLFLLCTAIWPDIAIEPHRDMCIYLADTGEPIDADAYRRKQVNRFQPAIDRSLVGARGILKSSILQAYVVQLIIQNPEIRILYLQNTIENAKRSVGVIKGLLEHNERIAKAFGHIIPQKRDRGKKYQWSSAGICVVREGDYPEPTITPAGIGTNLTSRHFNVIIMDDIVTATKDHMSSEEIRPSAQDIEKAIGWFRTQANGLLDRKPIHRGDPQHLYPPQRISLNNRWAPNDFVDFITRKLESFTSMVVPIQWPNEMGHPTSPKDESKLGKPTWPDGPLGTSDAIQALAKEQSSYIFNTQYLCEAVDPAENVFLKEYIQFYDRTRVRDIKFIKKAAFMDLAQSVSKQACFTAIVVVGMDEHGAWYILDACRGKWTTSEKIDEFYRLCELHKPDTFGVETVLFQEVVFENIRKDLRYSNLSSWGVVLVDEKPSKGEVKEHRIEAMQPRFRNGMVYMREDQQDLFYELTRYRRTNRSSPIDLIDSLSYIPRLMPDPVALRKSREKIGSDQSFGESISYEELEEEILNTHSRGGIFDDVFSSEELSF